MAFLLSKRLFKKHPRKCKSEIVFSSTLPEGLLEKNPVQWQQQEATLCMSDMSKKVVDTLPKRGRSKTGPIDISVSTWTLPRGTKNKVEHSFHRSLDDMSTPKGNRVYLNGGPVRPAPLPPSKKPSRKAPKPPASKQTTTGTISYSEQQLYDAPGLCMQHSPLMPGPPSSPLPPPVPTSPRPTSTSRIHSLSKLIPQPSLPEDSIYELAPLPTSSTMNHQEVPPPLPARINQSGSLPPKPPSTLRIPSLKPPAPPPTQPPRSRPAPPLPPVPPIPPKPAYMREPMEGINSTYCDLDSIQEACHNIHQVKVDKVEDENEDDVYTEMSAIGGNHIKEEEEEEEEEEEDEEEEEEEVEEEYSLMEYKAPERKEVFMNRIKEFEESFKSCVLPPLPPKAVPPETHYSKNVPKYFPPSHVQQQQASFPISLPAGQTENSVDTYEPVLYDDYDDETQEIYY